MPVLAAAVQSSVVMAARSSLFLLYARSWWRKDGMIKMQPKEKCVALCNWSHSSSYADLSFVVAASAQRSPSGRPLGTPHKPQRWGARAESSARARSGSGETHEWLGDRL